MSLEEMQNSESTSGFDKFMESLEEISKQQGGINQGTLQLGQLGMMQQQQLMEELQKQQNALKEKLSDLLGNNPGQDPGGGLHQTQDEMEEIIKDFKNKNVTTKTIERQERILSRMLDSQKSLQQKDYNNKRDANLAEDLEYIGPLGLPKSLGEKDIFLIKAMEAAMEEELSNEYEKLIQLYFLNLQKKDTEYEN